MTVTVTRIGKLLICWGHWVRWTETGPGIQIKWPGEMAYFSERHGYAKTILKLPFGKYGLRLLRLPPGLAYSRQNTR